MTNKARIPRLVARDHLRRLAGVTDVADVAELLEDLKTMDENLTAIERSTATHYASDLDPEVASQSEAYQKAWEGLKKAREAKKVLADLLSSSPDDKTILRMTGDADILLKRYQKHVDTTSKLIEGGAKKNLPPSLKDVAAKMTAALKTVIDPTLVNPTPWRFKTQEMTMSFRSSWVDCICYQVFYDFPKAIDQKETARLTLQESSMGTDGVRWGLDNKAYGPSFKTWTGVNEVLAKLKDYLRGWPGLKGESSRTDERRPIAKGIADALAVVLRGLDDDRGDGDVRIAPNLSYVSGAYRNWNLPKEGAYGMDEGAYGRIWKTELKKLEQKLDPWLDSYRGSIKSWHASVGDKNYVEVHIELK